MRHTVGGTGRDGLTVRSSDVVVDENPSTFAEAADADLSALNVNRRMRAIAVANAKQTTKSRFLCRLHRSLPRGSGCAGTVGLRGAMRVAIDLLISFVGSSIWKGEGMDAEILFRHYAP